MAVRKQQNTEWKDLFMVRRSQRRGLGLLMLLFLLMAGGVYYAEFILPKPAADLAALEAAWQPYAAPVAEPEASLPVELFHFDPNGLPVEQWVALGLGPRQAETIHRYEAKGGRFRSKADLGRMRVVDSALFATWEPYILLPDSTSRRPFPKQEQQRDRTDRWPRRERTEAPARAVLQRVAINTADSAALVALPGIGPAFARGLLRYRDLLGGYHDPAQFAEVRVLSDKPDAVARVRELLTVDIENVRSLDLNQASADQLGTHPYVGWKVAKALVAYRKEHGPFRRLEDVRGCVLVPDDLVERMRPYWHVE